MSDLNIINLCPACNKCIRETDLPFIGRPVVLNCGHVVHSTCLETDNNCKKCNKPVDFFTPLKIKVSDDSKLLNIDTDWEELVKQKIISLELDKIGKELGNKLVAVDFELDMLEKENESNPEYSEWGEAVVEEKRLGELLKFYENSEFEANFDENIGNDEDESVELDQDNGNTTQDDQTDDYHTCQEEDTSSTETEQIKPKVKQILDTATETMTSTCNSLSRIYCPLCFNEFNDKKTVNEHLKSKHSDKSSGASQLLSILSFVIGYQTNGLWQTNTVNTADATKVCKSVVNIKSKKVGSKDQIGNKSLKLINSKNSMKIVALGSEPERAKLFASFAALFKLFHKFGPSPFIKGYELLVIEQNKQSTHNSKTKKVPHSKLSKEEGFKRLEYFKKRLETLKTTKFK